MAFEPEFLNSSACGLLLPAGEGQGQQGAWCDPQRLQWLHVASQYLHVAGHELPHFMVDVKGQGQHFWSLQHSSSRVYLAYSERQRGKSCPNLQAASYRVLISYCKIHALFIII